ncbi:hypothetical protein K3495_g8526 [Podosphaera aphanis]|nr:hypothetical protein K3495_g8526 [Podosphaera aphanis]
MIQAILENLEPRYFFNQSHISQQIRLAYILNELEDKKLQESGFPTDPIERLTTKNPLSFNGLPLSFKEDNLRIHPNGKGQKIKSIDTKIPNKNLYVYERALCSWMSTNAQPQQACVLTQLAQYQEPDEKDIKLLDTTLKEQRDSPESGLNYIELKLDEILKVHC